MTSPECILSIVIPCFNHGKFIQDALDSINKDEILYPFEVIIVDDGSADAYTLTKLDELRLQGYTVISQKNAGPAAARNTGVAKARGKYILPLDADNKLTAKYINTGVAILEKGIYQIVYCTPHFFGDTEKGGRFFTSKPFDIADLLAANYIDNCSLYLKEIWITNNGYDTAIPYFGHEDWEFWINAYASGFKFYFLKEKLFYYRVVKNSVAGQFKENKKVTANRMYILKKHAHLFLLEYTRLSYIKSKYQTDINRLVFAPFIFLGYKLNIIKTPFKKAGERFNDET
jgi:glycosyltransferase involved in cell wall biosynthesis